MNHPFRECKLYSSDWPLNLTQCALHKGASCVDVRLSQHVRCRGRTKMQRMGGYIKIKVIK